MVVVVTNQVLTNLAQFFEDVIKPVDGNLMGHWAATRIYFRKSKGEKRVFIVSKFNE